MPVKDNEGNSYVEYSTANPFMAEMWPGGGKVQAEMYGMRLPNIRNLRMKGGYIEGMCVSGSLGYALEGGLTFCPGDGICLYSPPDNEPDYRIVAVYPYNFLTLEVEKI